MFATRIDILCPYITFAIIYHKENESFYFICCDHPRGVFEEVIKPGFAAITDENLLKGKGGIERLIYFDNNNGDSLHYLRFDWETGKCLHEGIPLDKKG